MIETCNLCGKEIKNVLYARGNGARSVVFHNPDGIHIEARCSVVTGPRFVPIELCKDCLRKSL